MTIRNYNKEKGNKIIKIIVQKDLQGPNGLFDAYKVVATNGRYIDATFTRDFAERPKLTTYALVTPEAVNIATKNRERPKVYIKDVREWLDVAEFEQQYRAQNTENPWGDE